MKRKIAVSVIIPFQTAGAYVIETVEALQRMEKNGGIEIILLPDHEIPQEFIASNFPSRENLEIFPTGHVSPAIKRDIGAEKSTGEILAFIDDDAYPDSDWLVHVLPYFEDPNICAVGGPQVTPENDGFWQKVSGATFLSVLNGGMVCRYWPCPDQKGKSVDDWPTVNLLVRREDFLAVGGFDSSYWPGEDTKLCLDLIEKRKKRIVYAPDAIVYHHRRAGMKKHLKQVGNYGLHRGFFARAYPATSFRPIYFVPSLFFLFLFLGWIPSLFHSFFLVLYGLGLLLYLSSIAVSTISIYSKVKNGSISVATIPYMVLTHIWYGIRFLKGFFFTKDLKSKLGR